MDTTHEISLSPLMAQLKKMIDCYRGGIMGLAQKSNVYHTTLRNISRGNIKRLPKPETVLKIATAISNKKTIVEIADFCGGEIYNYLRENFALNFQEEFKDYRHDLNVSRHLDDFYKYLAFKLCHKDGGITRHELENILAQVAMRRSHEIAPAQYSSPLSCAFIPLVRGKIDDLLRKEVLILNEDSKLTVEHTNGILDLEITLKYASEMSMFVKTEDFSKGSNLYMECFQYANAADIKRALRVYYAGMLEACKILADSKGDIPIQMLSMFDSVAFHSPGEEQC